MHVDRKHRNRVLSVCASAIVTALALCVPAEASQQSELLYSRGLVEFHAARYQPALDLFQQAVDADPEDVYALYYRGVTRGRMEDYPGAIADLRAVLQRKPDLAQATLELGIALAQDGQDAEAVPILEQAQRDPALEAQASLFLGLSQLRLRQREAAVGNLQRAAARDPGLQVPARYYQGVATYQAGEWATAEEHFAYVEETSPASALGREAAAMLRNLRAGRPGQPSTRPFELYGATALQYDTNVALAPSDQTLKTGFDISDQSDFRASFLAGGRAIPLRWDRDGWVGELSLGYEFFQSLHFDLTDFNLQDHRPYLAVVTNVDRFQLGLLGRYDYYLQGGDLDSFLSQGTVLPWFGIAEGSFGRTELFFRWRLRDYLQLPYNGLLDANNYSPGIVQYGYLDGPQRYAWVGYRFDREDPRHAIGDAYGYNGNEATAGLSLEIVPGFGIETSYAFRNENYFSASDGRTDREHLTTFVARKQLIEHLWLVAAYIGDINNSNQDTFRYRRHIGSLGVEARF